MATLKVYSREYGVKKVEEKVRFTILEWIIYTTFPILLFLTIYFMLDFYSINYSLKQDIAKNNIIIKKMKNNNEEQRVLINDLSSYERIKDIAKILGMESNKDNVKVVR